MSKIVKVTFIDASTGRPIFTAEMPPEDLPQSFEAATTMHIQDEDWQVIKAEPVHTAEFTESGQLDLTIQKINVQYLNPQEILFTIPTLSNEIGEILEGVTGLDKEVFSFHEDDWRQFEFVSTAYQAAIATEFEAIARIYREESVVANNFRCYRKVHIRKQITRPVIQPINLTQLYNSFVPPLYKYAGLSYDGAVGHVKGGFAFKLANGLVIYGQVSNDAIKVLGINLDDWEDKLPDRSVQALAAFMATYELCLVNWPQMQQIGSSSDEIAAYFN